MYNEQIEGLIDAALADGILTEKEKQILFKKAQSLGIDLDEFEMVLDSRLVKMQKDEQAKQQMSAPKSEKIGDVRKCPSCGAMVPALAGVCPECGYEFSGIEATLTSRRLSEMLLDVEREIAKELRESLKDINANVRGQGMMASSDRASARQQAEMRAKKETKQRKRVVIESIPVPITKADLFEFISALQVKVDDRVFGKSYRRKLDECILKARTLFANDKNFEAIISTYSAKRSKRKKKKLIITLSIILIIFCSIYIPIACSLSPKRDSSSCYYAVSTAIAEENYDKALSIIHKYKNPVTWIDDSYDRLISAYISKDDITSAKKIAKEYNGWDFRTAYKSIYTYYIQNGKYEDAEQFIPKNNSNVSYAEYYTYMKDCITHMIANGDRQSAISFFNNKKAFFNETSSESEYSQSKIRENLFRIINTK